MRTVGVTIALLAVLAAALPAACRSATKSVARAALRVEHAALDSVLADHVRPDGVDYRGLREHSVKTLVRYLDAMARVDPAALAPRERDAYELNLYNATMLRAVCDRLAPGWTPAADDFAVFKAPLVRLKGRTVSLNQLENDLIRPRMKDPRVHTALNCAARSCPALQPRAYRAATLDSALGVNMTNFLRDRSRNQLDDAGHRMHLSRLFDWYAADFGSANAVPAYVAHQLAVPAAGWTVEFMQYDWSLAASTASRKR
ncbi:MAG: DUF547 domain-containing protein [Candidatus Eisenbacteria bacterium]